MKLLGMRITDLVFCISEINSASQRIRHEFWIYSEQKIYSYKYIKKLQNVKTTIDPPSITSIKNMHQAIDKSSCLTYGIIIATKLFNSFLSEVAKNDNFTRER